MTAVKDMSVLTLALLFCSGLLLGWLCWKCHPIVCALVGVSMMAPFPAMTLAEGQKDPTTHNLFPFEIAVYCGISMIGLAGALLGRHIRNTVQGRRDGAR